MRAAGFVGAPAALRERRVHMRRNWGDDADRRAIFIERNDDFPRMQMQDGTAFARRCPIDRVAANGPTHCGAMDAKLMRASGQRFECEPSECLTLPWRGKGRRPLLAKQAKASPPPDPPSAGRRPPSKGRTMRSAPSPSISSPPAVRRDRVSSTSRGRHQAARVAARSALPHRRGRLHHRPIRFADCS